MRKIIYFHAVGIDSDNCAIRQWSSLQEHRKRLADLRTTLRQEAARDIRISLRRDIRRELNAKLRMVKGEQLNRLLAGYFDRGKQTLEMELPDGLSSDRHAWAAAAGEHGHEVYRDDDNNVDVQMQRLVRLQHLAQREIEAGWQPPAEKFHDFLNALASAKNGDLMVWSWKWCVLSAGQLSCGCISCSWYVWEVGRLRDLMLGVR